jgi:integrase
MARKSSRIPAYLTPEEIVRLFAAITSTRDRAIFRLAYHRGLRASELGMIQFGDYHYGRILIRRLKGSRGGEYVLVKAERMALRRWIGERGSAPGPMFPSRNHQGISRFRPHGLMKGYCAAAGIPAEKPCGEMTIDRACQREPPLLRKRTAAGVASIVTLLSDTGAPLIQFRGGLPLAGQDAERCSLCSRRTFALCASDVISNQVLVRTESVSCSSRIR